MKRKILTLVLFLAMTFGVFGSVAEAKSYNPNALPYPPAPKFTKIKTEVKEINGKWVYRFKPYFKKVSKDVAAYTEIQFTNLPDFGAGGYTTIKSGTSIQINWSGDVYVRIRNCRDWKIGKRKFTLASKWVKKKVHIDEPQ